MSEDNKKAPNMVKKVKKRPFGDLLKNYFGTSKLDIPQCYIDEANELGCECRWVNSKKLKENQGYHERGWRAYKFKSKPGDGILDSGNFAFGEDAAGIVRRGTAVLAIRPKEVGDAHRKQLHDRRERYKRFGAAKKNEFKDFVRGTLGKDAKIHEGYDD